MPGRNTFEYQIIGENFHQVLALDEDTQCDIYGYKTSCRSLLFHFSALLLLGVPYLLSSWFSTLKTIKYKKCDLNTATILLIQDSHHNIDIVFIKIVNTKVPNFGHTHLRFFHYRHAKFVWSPHNDVFVPLDELVPTQTVDDYLSNTDGLFYVDYIDLLKLYGNNRIEVDVKSYWRLFVEEVFNPFYVFQMFSIGLWLVDHYYIYAVCVLLLTLFSIVATLRQTRKQSEGLRDLVESSSCDNVAVIRRSLLSESILQDADSHELVPGDLLVLPKSDCILPCDVVLLTGECIMNESMLTGESVPVTKTALHSSTELYSTVTHKRHTLFSGTHMIQSRYYGGEQVLARVVKTGFSTTKGALVKSILYPTPVGLQFYKDSLKFVLALFLIAAAGTGYCLHLYIHRKAPTIEMLIRSLDIITIVVPPALPAAMTVGIVYSQNRLRKLSIFCISPQKINVCGKLKLACFDKTGTLTHDGLDMHSVIPINGTKFTAPVTQCHSLDDHDKLVQAMATCHSLTQVNNRLTGDPLDLSMFQFTNWKLDEFGDDENARFDMISPTIVKPTIKQKESDKFDELDVPYEIGIIKKFHFSSTLQCMSVICRELTSTHMVVFTKGAPEKIQSMCCPESIPKDFCQRLSYYTTRGYRVLGLSGKELPKKFKWKDAQRVKRDQVECDLSFYGLLIMQNALKPETTPIIKTLHSANIRTVMITGDNILTAISVARDCEMVKALDKIFILETRNDNNELFVQNIDSSSSEDTMINFNLDHCYLALDGKTWTKLRLHHSHLIPHILVRTIVFARFQPDQKTNLIQSFQSLDYIVSMVGDGANDCGALKAAHVGVSLSQAEASVAAPFTSANENISCIKYLMLEGRCALVTSFAVFKYMALYSLIQFTTVLILYREHSILGDSQFLFIDLILTTSLAVTISKQGPANKLGVKRPPGSLVAASTLIPVLLQIMLCAFIQIGALFYLYQQSWFKPVPHNGNEEIVECWENTVLFSVSSFQYLILAFVYSKGKPYRERLIRNFWFLVCALILLCFQTWVVVGPSRHVAGFFEIMFLPHKAHEQILFRYKLMLIPTFNFLLAIFIEVAIADRQWLRKLVHLIKMKKVPKNRYKQLLQDDNFLQDILS